MNIYTFLQKIELVYDSFYKVTVNVFWPWQKQIFRYSIFGLSHWFYRGSGVTVGSENLLQIFFKGHMILFKRGQGEHVLTMANLELKLSLFAHCPNNAKRIQHRLLYLFQSETDQVKSL